MYPKDGGRLSPLRSLGPPFLIQLALKHGYLRISLRGSTFAPLPLNLHQTNGKKDYAAVFSFTLSTPGPTTRTKQPLVCFRQWFLCIEMPFSGSPPLMNTNLRNSPLTLLQEILRSERLSKAWTPWRIWNRRGPKN